ncbi:MAG: histidine kinase [Oscillospiraceae bacterium]|nr:histidine kinase [Oscillospiraceae bacterium]
MKNYAIFARLFTGAILIITWGLTDSPLSGVAFILVLTALSAARYRFKLYKILMLAEILICVGYAFIWLPALLGLWLPLLGLLEDRWSELEQELLMKDYDDRAQRLKLEKQQATVALERKNAEQLAQINERARIAQDIHDHVGHEVTGALIAVQTALSLYESGDSRAGELLSQTVKRLESASVNLRETVHNLKPAKKSDLEILQELCDNFEFCNISFTSSGDVIHGEILVANLKEALTNIVRHSTATTVKVRVDSNADYIRMTVSDNGNVNGVKNNPKLGLGLRGMKERVQAVGGSITVSNDSGFKIVCILPKRG